ncbi:LytS/YhcK type 5TM receptor domain-containing protein [Staphylococcus aureus]
MTNCKFSLTIASGQLKESSLRHVRSIYIQYICYSRWNLFIPSLTVSENKRMVFSKAYVTVLMTIVSLLLSVYPIPYREDYLIHLTFVPLLFLGRFTNMVYTLSATVIVAIVEIVVFNNSIMYGVTVDCYCCSNKCYWTIFKTK